MRGVDIKMSQVKEELTVMIVFNEYESLVSEFLGDIDVAIVFFILTPSFPFVVLRSNPWVSGPRCHFPIRAEV